MFLKIAHFTFLNILQTFLYRREIRLFNIFVVCGIGFISSPLAEEIYIYILKFSTRRVSSIFILFLGFINYCSFWIGSQLSCLIRIIQNVSTRDHIVSRIVSKIRQDFQFPN